MNKLSDDWTEKYKPKKISELTTNTAAVKNVYSWLMTYEKNKKEAFNLMAAKKQKKPADGKKKKSEFKSCMIITGNHGVGKSTLVETILKEMKYDIQHINVTILKTGKNLEDVISKIISQTNIMSMIESHEIKKNVIIIDEIESITSATEKACITGLQKLNDIHWYCPIIFISNNHHNKLLSEIKKASFEVKLWPPYPSEMKKILFRISTNESIKIRHESAIEKIISHSQGDIRRLIYTLRDIKYAYEDQFITPNIADEYCETASRKDVDIDLYTATDKLLYEYRTMDDCLRLFETEKVLLPLMIHQNYTKSVISNNKDIEEQHILINKIAESLSIGDDIENYIYGDQNWEMQEIHGFYTCVAPSYHISENLPEIPNKNKTIFATDLNKTSIKKINKKNIINADRCFKNMSVSDYIYINKIVRNMIENDNIKGCVEILQDYDIELEHIESLLKIDKIKDTKHGLTSRQKTEFLTHLKKPKV